MIDNGFITDPAVDNTARGMMLVILSNRSDWRVYPDDIAKRCGLSRSTVDKYFKQLERAGYLRTIRKSLGYRKGTEVFRFFADFKLTDWYFEDYILPKLDAYLVEKSVEKSS